MINSSIKVVLSVLWVKNPQLFKFLSQNLSIIENLIFSNEILTIFTQCVRESYLKLAGLVIKWKLFKMHTTKYSGPKIFNSESSQFFFIWQMFHSINLGAQSFTSLKADIRQDINGGFVFSRCINEIYP